jgi:two-component system OmpR family sensor kinase
MRRLFATLTSRLVVTAVALVAVVCILIASITTVALRKQLMDRLDSDVHALGRPGPQGARNMGPGTLQVILPAEGSSVAEQGQILGRDQGEVSKISDLTRFEGVPTDRSVHSVDVPGHGTYRVIAFDGQLPNGEAVTAVAGLPTSTVDDTIDGLIRWEVLLTLLGILAAAAAGTVVVRRQLRPLREVAATAHTVAELPLATGDIGVTERVPERLTDAYTEVGQVGNALNQLLEHVESSLAARHRSEQQVRQFVADASHELRTPLTTIRGYAELARRHPDDAQATVVALTKVEEESGRMTGLVEDLLLLARLDAGRPLAHDTVDLSRLVLDAVGDARVLAPDHQWRVVAASPEAAEVDGDYQRLRQVVVNLLTNARTYTPAGTTVTVSVRPDGFSVHDDGPGFPPGLDPFERFARGDESRTGGSSGLGLAIVKAIVGAHGGRVTLSSVPGDTTVDVRLPVSGRR